MIIKLTSEWKVGPEIGSGGFGRVFTAERADGAQAVVKLVPKAPGAGRELLFVKLDGITGVVPIIDSGEHEDFWALVMPRAEESLRQHMDRASGVLSATEAIAILCDIAATLVELDGKVVHRDIKPENVLRLNGVWCLADFGIARYAEATTAPDTQKYSLSAPYAAPERWRAERATIAVDVYALGIIAFEMLSGSRPFPGPGIDDFRDQHLHKEPPILSAETATLKSIVSEALFKAPGARPSPANLLARLKRSQQQHSGGLAKLSDAHLGEVALISERERLASQEKSNADRREDLFRSASLLLGSLYSELSQAITDAAPSVKIGKGAMLNGTTLSLGSAQLELVPIAKTVTKPWDWEPPSFEVIAHAAMILRIPTDRHQFGGRSHSLWYCDAFNEGRYEWVETAFMLSPLVGKSTTMRPFLLDPGQDAAKAFWNGVAEVQLAWPLEPIDTENFIDRWSGWLGEAAQGRLQPPSTMPEKPTPRNWRQK